MACQHVLACRFELLHKLPARLLCGAEARLLPTWEDLDLKDMATNVEGLAGEATVTSKLLSLGPAVDPECKLSCMTDAPYNLTKSPAGLLYSALKAQHSMSSDRCSNASISRSSALHQTFVLTNTLS